MIVTLNEYTLALLVGGVSTITYVLMHLNDISENRLIPKKRKPKRNNSEGSDLDDEVSIPPSEMNRRQSTLAARYRMKRAESIKNDHVMFADEIHADDLKFTPNHDSINGAEVEGILHNPDEGGVVDHYSIDDFDVPTLNSFEKSQPLDDLLIRRRSLHSSPANSRSGSRAGSLRISAPEDNGGSDEDDEDQAVDAQDLHVKSMRTEIASLREDLMLLKEKEAALALDKSKLEAVLRAALAKIYPDKVQLEQSEEDHEQILEEYLSQL